MDEAGVGISPARYRAFISYSHADGRFAAWLHRKLEAWRVPDQGRLAPIFIDRAELAAGPDLSGQVREALAGSAALVVIASPAARGSQWVTQEIALFRELHPDSPIFAALIAGEPGEAFPAALLHHHGAALEPLAADFREGRDGKRLALLKIVAGLTTQPLDRVVQRDAQARQRRVMWITAGALLLSLVLAALLAIALRARAEADRQRAEAEGMVEFMLTDLRDKLKGTGSPTIMASVNERALKYYSQQDLDHLPDASLDRRARVLHAMGEDNERLGNFAAAQKMYAEAWRITGAVLARHPRDPDAIFAHAQSEYWVGEAAWQQGDLKTTEVHWRGYLTQAEALAKVEPGTKRSLMELGYANGNLCELSTKKDPDASKALPYCERSSFFMRQAVALSPLDDGAQLALANRLGWQADVNFKMKRLNESIALRVDEAAIMDRLLAQDPTNFQLQLRRVWPDIGTGQSLVAQGARIPGLLLLERSLADLDRLARAHPDDGPLTEQRFRVAWIIALIQRGPEPAAFVRYRSECADLLMRLRGQLTRTQFDRYQTMFQKLGGD